MKRASAQSHAFAPSSVRSAAKAVVEGAGPRALAGLHSRAEYGLRKLYFMGDLHHLTSDDAHAELGKVISGEKLGRRSAEKITIFDSRGTGIRVVGAAAHGYEFACERGTQPDTGMM